MKSLLPKNSAEIYVLGELYAKASRFIYNFVSHSFCARAPSVLSSYLFSFSRGERVYARCVQGSVESLRCVARVDQYRPPKRVIYVVIFVISIRKRSTRAIMRDERAFKKADSNSSLSARPDNILMLRNFTRLGKSAYRITNARGYFEQVYCEPSFILPLYISKNFSLYDN